MDGAKLLEKPCFKCRAIEPAIFSAVEYGVDWAATDPFSVYILALVDKHSDRREKSTISTTCKQDTNGRFLSDVLSSLPCSFLFL